MRHDEIANTISAIFAPLISQGVQWVGNAVDATVIIGEPGAEYGLSGVDDDLNAVVQAKLGLRRLPLISVSHVPARHGVMAFTGLHMNDGGAERVREAFRASSDAAVLRLNPSEDRISFPEAPCRDLHVFANDQHNHVVVVYRAA
jgi:hypothetical protein